jgi:hypothetical protein
MPKNINQELSEKDQKKLMKELKYISCVLRDSFKDFEFGECGSLDKIDKKKLIKKINKRLNNVKKYKKSDK